MTAQQGRTKTWVSWPVASRRGGELRRRVEVRGWEPPPEDPIDEATGQPLVWEAGHVRAWIREAMETLRRLPLPEDGLPRRPSSQMPGVVRELVEAYGYDRSRTREPVSPREIGRLEQVLEWLLWLTDRRDAVVVTGLALGLNLRAAGRLVGRSHEWCRQRERVAVETIARRLNRDRQRKTGLHERGFHERGLHERGLHERGLHERGLHETGACKTGA